MLAGWAIALTPHAGTVLTAVRMALVHDPDRGPFGAIPARVRIDRGLEFAAGAVHDAFAALSIDPQRLPAFHPHRKGKVERVHRTIDQTLLCGLPGFTGGPRDAAGRLYGPLDDRFAARLRAAGDPVTPMPIEAFAGLFAQWADWYNNERPHDGLDGRTPLQAWQDDPGPLHRISPDRLRHLLLASGERIIGKDGIRFSNLAYIAPELHGRGGQRVEIRYMPHDDRSIEVYLGGTHLCTAYPAERLTPEQTQAFLENAARERKRLTAERRKASARARAELVPLTRGETRAEESRVLRLAHDRGAIVVLDDAGGARVGPALLGQPRSLRLGVHLCATGLDKYGVAGPRVGLLGGRADLVAAARARAFELGSECRPVLYPAIAESLRGYSDDRVRDLVASTKTIGRLMRARLGEIAENTPFIFKLAGEAITTELNRRCGGASVELAPVEATAILAAFLLSDHGLLTVHFAGLPPGTSALLIKFISTETVESLGGTASFVNMIDQSLTQAAQISTDLDAVRALLLGPTSLGAPEAAAR